MKGWAPRLVLKTEEAWGNSEIAYWHQARQNACVEVAIAFSQFWFLLVESGYQSSAWKVQCSKEKHTQIFMNCLYCSKYVIIFSRTGGSWERIKGVEDPRWRSFRNIIGVVPLLNVTGAPLLTWTDAVLDLFYASWVSPLKFSWSRNGHHILPSPSHPRLVQKSRKIKAQEN